MSLKNNHCCPRCGCPLCNCCISTNNLQSQRNTAGDSGARCPAGPTGPAGLRGATGPAGPAGLRGATGSTGLRGATGSAGLRGITGPTGPTGESGVINAVGFQAQSIDSVSMFDPDDKIMFNVVSSDTHPDISYDMDTGIFTVNKTKSNSFYLVSWWLYIEGYGNTTPFNIVLNVNDVPFSTQTIYFTEAQVSGSAIVPATANTFTLSLANSSPDFFTLMTPGVQAQITILGFKS